MNYRDCSANYIAVKTTARSAHCRDSNNHVTSFHWNDFLLHNNTTPFQCLTVRSKIIRSDSICAFKNTTVRRCFGFRPSFPSNELVFSQLLKSLNVTSSCSYGISHIDKSSSLSIHGTFIWRGVQHMQWNVACFLCRLRAFFLELEWQT
jgi:hypothetical protein